MKSREKHLVVSDETHEYVFNVMKSSTFCGLGFKSVSDFIRFVTNNYEKGKCRMPDTLWQQRKEEVSK